MPVLLDPLLHAGSFLGLALVAGLWQGALLAAAVALCLRLLPRTSATLRFSVWLAVLALVACLPFTETLTTPHTPATAAPLVHINPRWGLAIAALWAAAALLRAASLALGAVQLHSLRRNALRVHAPAVAALLHANRRSATLCTSTAIDRPGVVGFLAPRILIPAWLFPQLTAPELEGIVLHEMEHLRRRDDWLNLLQKLSLVLFPLNPVLLWVERRLCLERELACDDGVLRHTAAPRAYATCLTRLAERGMERGMEHQAVTLALSAIGSLGTAARRSELARRVHRILRRERGLRLTQARLATATLVLGLLTGAAALSRSPQLVSFTPTPSPELASIPAIPTDAPPISWPTSYDLTAAPATKHLASQHVGKEQPATFRPANLVLYRPVPRPAQPSQRKHTRRAAAPAPRTHHPHLQATAAAPHLRLTEPSEPLLALATTLLGDDPEATIQPTTAQLAPTQPRTTLRVAEPLHPDASDRLLVLPYTLVPSPTGGWLILLQL